MSSANDAAPVAAGTGVVEAAEAAAPVDDGPSVLGGSAANLLGLLAASGLSALGGLVTARLLGAEAVGILAVAFGLVEFGRSLSNFTHNPSILEYHRNPDAGTVFGTSLALKVTGSSLFIALAVLLDPVLSAFFGIPRWSLVLTSTVIVLGSFTEIGTARLEANHDVIRRNLLLVVGPAVGMVAVAAYILFGVYNVFTAITTSLLGTLAMSVGFALAWPRPWRFRYEPRVARYLVGYGSRIVAAGILAQALIWTDTLMLSAILGNEAAGVYNVAFQLTFVMVVASVSIGTALLPAMSRLAGRGESTTLAYQRATLLSLALCVAVALAYLVGGRFFLYLYGAEFMEAYAPLLVLTVFGIAGALAVPAQSALTVHGHAGTLTMVSLAQAVLNVPLNYVFIHLWGILGAAVATTTVFVGGTVVSWVVVHRVTGAWPLSRAVLGEALRLAGPPRWRRG